MFSNVLRESHNGKYTEYWFGRNIMISPSNKEWRSLLMSLFIKMMDILFIHQDLVYN